jgi:hypothetical protein
MIAHYDDPMVHGVGGSATAVWTGGPRPRWLPAEFDWIVGCTYVGQPTRTAHVRNLVGCNMSFRREVFDIAGGFSDRIGRVGTKPVWDAFIEKYPSGFYTALAKAQRDKLAAEADIKFMLVDSEPL